MKRVRTKTAKNKVRKRRPSLLLPASARSRLRAARSFVLRKKNDKTTLPARQPETMEVHRHAHAAHTRKFTDYLYEFVMLFLAVMAGFLVENEREHFIENQRAKQYSRQLLSDLRADSLLFERRAREIAGMQNGHDRLQHLLTQKEGATDKEVLEVLLPIVLRLMCLR